MSVFSSDRFNDIKGSIILGTNTDSNTIYLHICKKIKVLSDTFSLHGVSIIDLKQNGCYEFSMRRLEKTPLFCAFKNKTKFAIGNMVEACWQKYYSDNEVIRHLFYLRQKHKELGDQFNIWLRREYTLDYLCLYKNSSLCLYDTTSGYEIIVGEVMRTLDDWKIIIKAKRAYPDDSVDVIRVHSYPSKTEAFSSFEWLKKAFSDKRIPESEKVSRVKKGNIFPESGSMVMGELRLSPKNGDLVIGTGNPT